MFASKLLKFKRNLNVLFRERLKIQKGPKLFSVISRSAVYEMIHLNAFKEFQFNYIQQEMYKNNTLIFDCNQINSPL